MKIWHMLHSCLMWCFGSHCTGANDVEETDKITVLKKLCSTFKYVLGFLESMKEEIQSIAVLVRGVIMPEEQVSSDDAVNWFQYHKDHAIVKLKEFSNKLPTDIIKQLDRVIVILKETEGLEMGILFKLSEAIVSVDVGWHDGKNYKMMAREVEYALNIMRSEKLLRK